LIKPFSRVDQHPFKEACWPSASTTFRLFHGGGGPSLGMGLQWKRKPQMTCAAAEAPACLAMTQQQAAAAGLSQPQHQQWVVDLEVHQQRMQSIHGCWTS
jgi:hypothetical protein